MKMAETVRPWTAIFPLNEEYFLASQEIEKKHELPIIRLVSRKTQQDGRSTPLPSKPWEKYESKEIECLNYNFDADDPTHEGFSLQDQAKRDRNRGLKAVFIDSLTLRIPLEIGKKECVSYEAIFELKKVPSGSQTGTTIRELIKAINEKHDLYPQISKRDTRFYKRIFQNPSCLEIVNVAKVAMNPRFHYDISDRILGGLTDESQRFLSLLAYSTANILELAYKRFDTRSGYILDGIIPTETIRERLNI